MSIQSISPIDGRYGRKTLSLQKYFSEKALISYRIKVEAYYLIALTKTQGTNLRSITDEEEQFLKGLFLISDEEAEIVKAIETKGYKSIPATNHDVKAVEYFIKEKLKKHSTKDLVEMVHFALTSEDINNLAYGLMLFDAVNDFYLPVLNTLYTEIFELSKKTASFSMLARTHGQTATPVTFGKEMLVFVNRIKEELVSLKNCDILVKLNGATGNYNAHYVVFPAIDWEEFTERLIKSFQEDAKTVDKGYLNSCSLKIRRNYVTTQIESHDGMARIFDSLKHINNILTDFSQDIWRYISDGWIKQQAVKGEIGSSAMPHKVNPIDFENAEGNFGIANALFTFFSSKLPISRLQRDLSDSTVQRNIGVAFAHTSIAFQSLMKGLSKIAVDKVKLEQVLKENPEVIAEAYQNILRSSGVEKPYELLKEVTRGKNITLHEFTELVHKLKIDDSVKSRLLSIRPENYTGIAEKIVERFDPFV